VSGEIEVARRAALPAKKVETAARSHARRDAVAYRQHGLHYGYDRGKKVAPPKGWVIIPLGDPVPDTHRDSSLMELRFADSESTFDYFEATKSYLGKYGKPVAFYSDKHSVFRVNSKDHAKGGSGLTQFGRALEELNIDIICANSPQAKGRVERANLTLQDRLVKELRLAGVTNQVEGQAFLETFRADYNRRFAKPPRQDVDVHRPLRNDEHIDDVFTIQVKRTLSHQLIVHYKRRVYVVEDSLENRKFRGKEITVYEYEDGAIVLRCDGRLLSHVEHRKDDAHVTQGDIVSNKLLAGALSAIAEKQKERDAVQLSKEKMTVRDKKRILQRRATALA
jgi:hypothetical protein